MRPRGALGQRANGHVPVAARPDGRHQPCSGEAWSAMDWRFLEERFCAVYSDKPGQPLLPTWLMAGLAILKHMRDLSDEVLCRAIGGKSLFSAVLQQGVLPAQASLRSFVADALAPAWARRSW